MSYSDWQANPSPAGSSQESTFRMRMTLDGFSYTPSEEEKARDAAQEAATGRKSYKTLKGIGEAVWPPALEAALIEALEKYDQENVARSDKSQRYPKRNRYISDYIFQATSKRRNPKQVGSRLQQLRDTCKNERILKLVKPRSSLSGNRASSEESLSSPSPDYRFPHSPSSSPSNSPPLVGVVISLEEQLFPSPIPSVSVANYGYKTSIQLSPLVNASSSSSQPSNSLQYLSRVIELVSPVPLEMETSFAVYRGDSPQPIHCEPGFLSPYSTGRSGWVYRTELLPNFWESLCFIQGQDIMSFKILQRLKPCNASAPGAVVPETIGVMYTFSVPSTVLRRASSIGVNAHGDPRAQTVSYHPQAMQSPPTNYPYSSMADNLEDSWVPHLTQRGSREAPPMAAESRSMQHTASSFGPDPNYRMDRGQRTEMTSRYLTENPSFNTNYPIHASSSQPIHAPVPISVNHQQQLNMYHKPYSHL